MSAQVLPTDVLVPEPECFSKAGWVKSEEKQLFSAWMPFSQLGQPWRLVSKWNDRTTADAVVADIGFGVV